MLNLTLGKSPCDPIMIVNKQQLINTASTNYWDTDFAEKGALFLSWNAGAARLLVPDQQIESIREMRTAKNVVISFGPFFGPGGPEALELLFEDESESPFIVTMGMNQTDRPPLKPSSNSFPFTVWTRKGLRLRRMAKTRVVPRIPWAERWSDDNTV